MLERIKKILLDCNEIDDFKIVETETESSELFLVKKAVDVNRAKKVHYFNVTVYKNFEEDGKKHTGSSMTKIHPTMTDEEIRRYVEEAAFAAGFIKNENYPLVEGNEVSEMQLSSRFDEKELQKWFPSLTEALYKPDNHEKGGLNSSEFFLNKTYTRIVNSKGVDASYTKHHGEIEFITNWKEDKEEIELYKNIRFSDVNLDMIEQAAREMLEISKEKASAKPTPVSGQHAVLLTGSPVEELLSYYASMASAQMVYNGLSKAKIGGNIQGDDVTGDLISLTLDPFMENSTESVPYDEDGLLLKKTEIYKDGILKNYHGNTRYCHYMNVEPTGNIGNEVFEGGKHSIEDLKKEPYLEVVAFSDFQIDDLTGDFGGEIRLGWYFDGNETIPVTGGSISGNINKLHHKMYLSKETQKDNNFVGPKTIKLLNVSVAGIS